MRNHAYCRGAAVALIACLLIVGLAGCGSAPNTEGASGSGGEQAPQPVVAKASGPVKVDFSAESPFVPMVGVWSVVDDAGNKVLKLDGTKYKKGDVMPGVEENAKILFPDSAEFGANVKAHSDYPFAVLKTVDNFKNGEIAMRFKSLSGKEDQCAGILFDVKPNGDYLTVRANPLENNINFFEMKNGVRTKLKEVKDVATPQYKWGTISAKINGADIEVFLDGKSVAKMTAKQPVDGKVGIWSKSDSEMYYDDYTVTPQ